MKYNNVITATFLSRPNRFIAMVNLKGKIEKCHIKNTGRCKELLIPGAEVFLEKSTNTERKTAYDVIGVKKGEKLINMDSQAPNKVVEEWIRKEIYFKDITLVKPECKYGNSRVDFYAETAHRKRIFIEVKGVTLEEDGIARFPDAPTERGIKHIKELQKAVQEGYEAYILFVVQMKGIRQFEPNDKTHEEFGNALRESVRNGVGVLCYDCVVTKDTLTLDSPVKVIL